MKPEPLKGKCEDAYTVAYQSGLGIRPNRNNTADEHYWVHRKNIKSAVEWLKEEVKTRDIPKGKNLVLELIDKAFEDVVNSPKRG